MSGISVTPQACVERQACSRLATVALDLKPAEPRQQGWPGKIGEQKD
jgi:hypothetical protein